VLAPDVIAALEEALGAAYVRTDAATLEACSTDALKRGGHPPDAVVLPGGVEEVAAVARLCHTHRIPLVPRGAGTGYTGGAVPVRGGIVVSLERLNRILAIDEANLLAIVEPHVITGDLQAAVERVGLFYPPDPASLEQSTIGGNVAECAGGPRAFKYGTTRHYVLGVEAVLPTGEILRVGGKTAKNVVGYDLTHLLVGSEGTLAILTRLILRLVPLPPAAATVRAAFADVHDAARAVIEIVRERVVPAALEIVDGESLRAVAAYTGATSLAPEGTAALLLIEVDGLETAVLEETARVEEACRRAGATSVARAAGLEERADLWRVRRELSYALRAVAPLKLNHDVVVPKGRIPELFAALDRLRQESRLRLAAFGHAGDGNIHVNLLVDPDDADEMRRARAAERALFEAVVALEGSITGEHGVGFTKSAFLSLELAPEVIALMKRVKHAFDPHGILNPGKIFPEEC
jgi:glycolate oxidase